MTTVQEEGDFLRWASEQLASALGAAWIVASSFGKDENTQVTLRRQVTYLGASRRTDAGARTNQVFFFRSFTESGEGWLFAVSSDSTPEMEKCVRDQITGRIEAHLVAAYEILHRADDHRGARKAKPGHAQEMRTEISDAELDVNARAAVEQASRIATLLRQDARPLDVIDSLAFGRLLADARMSIIDEFESGRSRMVISCVELQAIQQIPSVSPREKQVLIAAARGHANKAIAYDLGIAESTVAQLLLRGLRRLGATSRKEKVRLFSEIRTRMHTKDFE